jgi:hypothetical protein
MLSTPGGHQRQTTFFRRQTWDQHQETGEHSSMLNQEQGVAFLTCWGIGWDFMYAFNLLAKNFLQNIYTRKNQVYHCTKVWDVIVGSL